MNIRRKFWQSMLVIQVGLLSWVIFKTFFAWGELMAVVHLDGFPYQGGPDKVTPSAIFIAALVFSTYITSRFIETSRQ